MSRGNGRAGTEKSYGGRPAGWKRSFSRLLQGEPGKRFTGYYERTKQSEPLWKSALYISLGIVLVLAGVVLGPAPGLPGFLVGIPGLALIAARFRPVAVALDRAEGLLRRWLDRWRNRK